MRGALKDYNEAIRLSPEYGEAFYNRSITLGAMGDHKHAGEDLDEALRLGFKPKA
jgi:tetratricopeptide (TPR) repeat protein